LRSAPAPAGRAGHLHGSSRETEPRRLAAGVPFGRWLDEQSRRSPTEYGCDLARDRFWRDGRRALLATHPDFPDVTLLLEVDEIVAKALLLVLSRLPQERRQPFAEAFYELRRRGRAVAPTDPPARLSAGAAIALLVVELAAADLRSERVLDLLQGAAQGDDLTRTPAPAVAELRKAIARVRFDAAVDELDPRRAASLAVAEVLDPSGDSVAVEEVSSRAALAAVESWEPPRVLGLLLEIVAILAAAHPR
jgi:hypothetical protein